ncbi:hypothetical protein AB0L13_16555 [Saccharopolyspora shandongensis]|uniref:hypothetical protein n=1 Tax=Saccharopolyspora shandongensis TaxID=418495 RepID=UPI0034329ABA
MKRPQWMTWRIARAVVLVLLVCWVGWLTLTLGARTQQAEQQTGRADSAERRLDQLADDVARVCQQGGDAAAKLGAACVSAERVARQPNPLDEPRGIAATSIAAGRLVVTYTDGTRRDVGPVVGPGGPAGLPGADGADGSVGSVGPAGRGIAGTALDGVDLVVTYTDGTTENLGRVVGPAGRGIAEVDTRTGRLLVTYDDGTTDDAGPLPPGPQGEPGTPGPSCPDGYELRPVLLLAADGASTYDGVGCVEPGSSSPTKPR